LTALSSFDFLPSQSCRTVLDLKNEGTAWVKKDRHQLKKGSDGEEKRKISRNEKSQTVWRKITKFTNSRRGET